MVRFYDNFGAVLWVLVWSFAAALCLSGVAAGQDQLLLDPEVRYWYRNPDGSCVQCSMGINGTWSNNIKAATLLWKTEHGPAVRGGSGPSRVEAYCDARGIPIYNVTGDGTVEWMKWAARNGRTSAVGCFYRHFQNCMWYNPDPADPRPWKVCNNNSAKRIDQYTEAEFIRHHRNSGYWIVVLKGPSPPYYPEYTQWW